MQITRAELNDLIVLAAAKANVWAEPYIDAVANASVVSAGQCYTHDGCPCPALARAQDEEGNFEHSADYGFALAFDAVTERLRGRRPVRLEIV